MLFAAKGNLPQKEKGRLRGPLLLPFFSLA
jgi:hypothetical protein